jgi:hypothetical protein
MNKTLLIIGIIGIVVLLSGGLIYSQNSHKDNSTQTQKETITDTQIINSPTPDAMKKKIKQYDTFPGVLDSAKL